MDKKNSVYIIGYESISCLGLNIKEQFNNLLKQKIGYSNFKAKGTVRHYGELSRVKNLLDKRFYKSIKKIGGEGILHNYLLNVIKNLKIKLKTDPEKIGVFIGSSTGDLELMDNLENVRFDNSAHICLNSLSSLVSREFNAEGESYVISQACSTGIMAVIAASRAIKSGDIDVAIVGAVDASFEMDSVNSANEKILSSKNIVDCFSKNRDGTVNVGGAGILILMSEKKAKGFKKYGKILGYSNVNKSAMLKNIANEVVEDGYITAMKNALKMSKLKNISLVGAHATGTYLNDLREASAINKVLPNVLVCSMKKFIGHGITASSIIETSLYLESMKKGIILGMGKVDLDYEVDININEKNKRTKIDNFILNSSGFNGTYGSVIIGAIE